MTPPSRSHLAAVTAFAWGFAEATLFFVVPDVWLTWIVTDRSLREALGA